MTQTTRYLTKSRFKLAVGCPTKLYYTGKPAYPSTLQDDAFMAALAEGGFQVGELAKLMYPGGVEVLATGNDDAEQQTLALLAQDEVTLFEPAIRHGNLFIRIDVLVKNGGHFDLIEVKAKSWDSAQAQADKAGQGPANSLLSYVQDIAFQAHVLKLAYPAATISCFLLMPDKSRPATVDGLNQMFKLVRLPPGQQGARKVDAKAAARHIKPSDSVLALVDVDDAVSHILTQPLQFPGGEGLLSQLAERWASAYQEDKRIKPHTGSHCARCEFRTTPGNGKLSGFHECWTGAHGLSIDEIEGGTVLDIWNFRHKNELISQGIVKLDPQQITKEHLRYAKGKGGLSNSERQWLQIAGLPEHSRDRGHHTERDIALGAMQRWVYPLHFIDFETCAVALPFNSGRRPYEQIAFQFSHHVLDADGKLSHQDEFLLATPGVFPNYEFVRALKNALANDRGSVFMWSPHERTVLRQIAEQLRKDADAPADSATLLEFIDSLTESGPRALIDLRMLAQKAFFYPETRGGCSIKRVLPAVLKDSAFLKARYSSASYGSPSMPSHNFKQMSWWVAGDNGLPQDPYSLLGSVAPGGMATDDEVSADNEAGIASGGAAATAYSRLQFEDLPTAERDIVEKALLRYCELDTLAMAMVVQAWQEELGL